MILYTNVKKGEMNMSYNDYNICNKVSSNTKILISEYYVELHKKGLVKTKKEICSDLMISDRTLSYYWRCLDLSENCKYLGNMEKIVLSHTEFSAYSQYTDIRKRFLEYQEELKRIKEDTEKRESHRRLSEILQLRTLKKQIELKEARENLVKTLGKVYEIRHK